MPDLRISVESASVVPYSVSPLLSFRLRIENQPEQQRVHTVVLRAQVQIDVVRRRYNGNEEERLRDLFGEPARWSHTLRTMHWTHTSTVIQAFAGTTSAELPVPCSYDFNVAATKYFAALEEEAVPVSLLFSGTVFFEGERGALQVAQVPWDNEAVYRMPVEMWRKMMDAYYPNSAWLCLGRETFDRLYRYRVERGIGTWDQAIESMLAMATRTPCVSERDEAE